MKAGSALLFRQITLITLLVGAIAVVLILINTERLSRSLLTRTREQAELVAVQAAAAVETVLADSPGREPRAVIRESQPLREFAAHVVEYTNPVTSMEVEDNTGAALISVPESANMRTRPPFTTLLKFPTLLSLLLKADAGSYEYYRALDYQGKPLGGVRLGLSVSAVRDEVAQSLIINLLITLASLAAATFIAISSTRLVTAPLRAITSTIELMEKSDTASLESEPAQTKTQATGIGAVADRMEQISRQIAGDRTQLKETRGRLQQILSNLQESILLVSADGRVMLTSPGVEKILGVEQISEGLSLEEILGHEHHLVSLTRRALSSRGNTAPVALSSVNGVDYTSAVRPIMDRGETVGALISLRDRETFARLETQLDYSERLADFARITSGIAHEVKNPLNAMVIHLELLRSKLDRVAPLADESRPQLDIITSEIQRLDRVVQTFLDFTRTPRVSVRPLDLNRLLEDTLQLAAPEAEAYGAEVERDFFPDLPTIAGDHDLLKQAFLNIIINGFQAMDKGGRLRVATTMENERTVLVSITDHGAGIPPEARARIFQLYFTTKPHGHGIGLAQAFRAVQIHNGQISFESTPASGTTFYLRFPKQ